MMREIAQVIYEVRRALQPATAKNEDGDVYEVDRGAPFEELTSEEREPLLAEVRGALHDGKRLDPVAQAIVDALK